MATNKDLLKKLDTISEKVCNQDIEQIKSDLKEIKEVLLDPEDGLVVRINKNTYNNKNTKMVGALSSKSSTVGVIEWSVGRWLPCLCPCLLRRDYTFLDCFCCWIFLLLIQILNLQSSYLIVFHIF